ncbi:electron transfer flavoprotein subunit alpha/FixB family protein [Chromohalobacter japonicus]|uniref:electron transfer flavoprotein subunit alpha/FixB family protein n=1 Tax=Chromohalobacter japonicus TaxID=223900 RepID=UPI00058B5E02|nr:electron transfer flavoprotein subunit alpha/FixB family protein [Chromohalobacter japonicus]
MSDLPRRDPRQEWIARNRLHPRHAEVLLATGQGAASEWWGPGGLVRRNPHAVGFIGPNGVKRIDRSGTQQGAGGGGAATPAAGLGERPATGVWQAEADAEAATGWHCTARGAAGSLDIRRPLPRLALALAECAEPVSETRHAAAELALPQPLPSTLSRIQDLGQVSVDPSGVALSEAEFLLSAGNGVKDWPGFHHAAEVLRATEGASRVAVDDGFMARDRQVGATGTWVTARVYVAVGISGAIQHLQGIQTCDKVVAINMDPGCDMIKRADLAVIGDSTQILEALVTLVAQAREEKRDAA